MVDNENMLLCVTKRQASYICWLVYNFWAIFRHFAKAPLKKPEGTPGCLETLVEKGWSRQATIIGRGVQGKSPNGNACFVDNC